MPVVNSNITSPITSICSSPDYTRLFTSDSNGYLTIWSLSNFLSTFNLNDEIDLNKNSSKISMTVCWRAHLTKIVRVVYCDVSDFLFSASADESIRIWSASSGRYLGFLGQTKPLVVPRFETTDWISPYDINEAPIHFNKYKSSDRKTLEKNYEYPLVLDKMK